ncbi:MAG: NAD(+)/NADH kinase [Lachnospiraceae bacterium]|nr:NAD(+)/NADH kinase [Lachnospiraceae bacterium]
MKHVIIITNKPKDPQLLVTREICTYLEEVGVTCSVYADEISAGKWQEILHTEGKQTDMILVLGGDGTLLRAAKDTAQAKIPVIGVNLGTLGYLAEVERTNLKPALDQLLAGDYTIEERMMLKGQVFRNGKILEDCCALNDVAIVRNGRLQMLYFQIFVNGKFLKEYFADGMIVATPTGSTGYNMSAGGPIVEPAANLLLLTPVCPHTLQNRSVILKAEDEILIRVRKREGYEQANMDVTFDGGTSVGLEPGDEVRIVKSDLITSIIKLSEASFLDVLQRKLRE